MTQNKQSKIKRKQSVYLDTDLQTVISREYNRLHDEGLEITVGAIIRKHLRVSYGIPKAARHDK